MNRLSMCSCGGRTGVIGVGSLSVSGKLKKNTVNLFWKRRFFIILSWASLSWHSYCTSKKNKLLSRCISWVFRLNLAASAATIAWLLQRHISSAGLPHASMTITIGMSFLTVMGGVNYTFPDHALHYVEKTERKKETTFSFYRPSQCNLCQLLCSENALSIPQIQHRAKLENILRWKSHLVSKAYSGVLCIPLFVSNFWDVNSMWLLHDIGTTPQLCFWNMYICRKYSPLLKTPKYSV